METSEQQHLVFRGNLLGHNDWVTSIAMPQDNSLNIAVSASRDKKVIIWSLDSNNGEPDVAGYAKKSLLGHGHYIEDVVMSNDGLFAVTGSWDKSLRLWDLQYGKSLRDFQGHTSDVHSVAFSPDNRQIVSGGRDKTIRLWNTLAQCKYIIDDNCHKKWVNSVRFSPVAKTVVSGSSDGSIKVWNLENCRNRDTLKRHTGLVKAVAISPDGSLCASGATDSVAHLWDMNDGKHLCTLEAQKPITDLCFSPCMYWLCAATTRSVVIWDLENRSVHCEIVPNKGLKTILPWFTSLAWNAAGSVLLVGCCDGSISVYEARRPSEINT